MTQAILIEDDERLIEKYYEMIEVLPGMRHDIAGKIHTDLHVLMANEAKELSRLTRERDPLDDERMKLLQADCAGAEPIDLLKQEQDRIANEIGDISTGKKHTMVSTLRLAHTSTTRSAYSPISSVFTTKPITRIDGCATRHSFPGFSLSKKGMCLLHMSAHSARSGTRRSR